MPLSAASVFRVRLDREDKRNDEQRDHERKEAGTINARECAVTRIARSR